MNPEVILREGKQYEEEGCLSFPEIREKISRAAKVRIRAQDENGKWFEMDGERGLLARAFQHEIDHPRRRGVHLPHERIEGAI